MSCSTPFEYVASESYEPSSYTVGFSGSTSISGYKIPSEKLCMLGWNPAYSECTGSSCMGCGKCKGWNCSWNKCCKKWCTKYTWHKGSHYWYDCWTSPAVTLMPDLDIEYNLSTQQTYQLPAGESISVEGAQTVIASSIEITKLEMGINVNGTGVNIVIPISVTIEPANGVFQATYDLASVKEVYKFDGIEYDMKFSFALEACALPKPPVGWLNLQVSCDLSIQYENVETYSITFITSCPIVSVVG